METIKIWNDSPSEKQLHDIASRLEAGEIALVPTDAVYSIVCDCMNAKAIERVCSLKGINPQKATLSVICSGISMASQYAQYDDEGYNLLREYTPGPFTIIFKASRSLPRAFKDRKEVGIRIPSRELPRLLADYMGHPLLATSAEFESDDEAREPSLLAERYEKSIDFMVEGDEGDTRHTTIIDGRVSPPEIIRQGKGDI